MGEQSLGDRVQVEQIRAKLEAKLEKTTNLKDKADLIVDFCLKYRGTFQDYRGSLIDELIKEGEEQGNHYALGSAYTALIWDSIDAGKYKEGARFAVKAQENHGLAGEKRRKLQALNGEDSALKALGKFDEALNKYLDGLEKAKEMEDKELAVLFLSNLGGLMNALGQYDEALLYFQEIIGLQDSKEDQDPSVFYMMALSYHLQDEFNQSKPLFTKAAELSEKQGMQYLNALCKYRLAQIYIAQDRVTEGEVLIQRAFAKSEELKIPTLKTNALVEMAKIVACRGNHQGALAYALEATEIAKATEGKESLLKKIVVLGEIQGSLGNYEQAYIAIQEARGLELEQYTKNLLNSLKIAKAKQVRRENMIYNSYSFKNPQIRGFFMGRKANQGVIHTNPQKDPRVIHICFWRALILIHVL